VRIGVLGLTTPGFQLDNPQNYEGLEFREPVAEAKKWVAVCATKSMSIWCSRHAHGPRRRFAYGIINPDKCKRK